jgi:glycyl-tRNA synthetase beta chain
MVKEFTDLQGIVGGIYARREGHPDAVWKAIYDQYRPASAGDELPREASGAVLSLADRFDALAGFFQIGLPPTGSRDPYGLRRAAYGAVAIIGGSGWRLDWRPVMGRRSLYREGMRRFLRTAVAAGRVLRRAPAHFLERRPLLTTRSPRCSGLVELADVADRAPP